MHLQKTFEVFKSVGLAEYWSNRVPANVTSLRRSAKTRLWYREWSLSPGRTRATATHGCGLCWVERAGRRTRSVFRGPVDMPQRTRGERIHDDQRFAQSNHFQRLNHPLPLRFLLVTSGTIFYPTLVPAGAQRAASSGRT